MNILGIDTTGKTLSVALKDGEKLLGELYIDAGKKHAETLMCAISSLFELCGMKITDVDFFACATGPGSFTGIRIGVAAAAGLAHAAGRPVVSVNTLDALIKNAGDTDKIVCAIMDARRGEVYAMAKQCGNVILGECAMSLEDVLEKLPDGPAIFVGDGVLAYRELVINGRNDTAFLNRDVLLQRAPSVCAVAAEEIAKGNAVKYNELRPHYLRESQAERLRNEKMNAGCIEKA